MLHVFLSLIYRFCFFLKLVQKDYRFFCVESLFLKREIERFTVQKFTVFNIFHTFFFVHLNIEFYNIFTFNFHMINCTL